MKAVLRHGAGQQHRLIGFTNQAMAQLCSNHWPGNVRELENVIERAVVLCRDSQIRTEDIIIGDTTPAENVISNLSQDFPTIAQLEQRYIHCVLQKTAGRKDKAAQILGINRRTLYRKEREYCWVEEEEEEGEIETRIEKI
jgi:DNA-binding NtrC family response regulator